MGFFALWFIFRSWNQSFIWMYIKILHRYNTLLQKNIYFEFEVNQKTEKVTTRI